MKEINTVDIRHTEEVSDKKSCASHKESTAFLPVEPSYRLKFIILTASFMIMFFASFFIGRYSISPNDFFDIIMSQPSNFFTGISEIDLFPDFLQHFAAAMADLTSVNQSWETAAEIVLLQIRMPRVIAAAIVGGALATSGAAYQGMFRNPMVSPDILGASSGAGFGAALGILMYFNYVGITISAFIFGISAVMLAYIISRVSRMEGTLAMVLAGMIISSLFSACTSFVKLIADTDDVLPAITYWLMGSLSSIKQVDIKFIFIPVLVGIIPIICLRWRLNLLTVSEEESRSLGINTTMLRLIVIVCATLMTSASVAISGMIGWVGLVIPHFCRIIFGYDYRRLIPAAFLFGASFLMLVDNIARNITTSEIPIGILTSFVGAPVFLYLILSGGKDNEY